MLWLASQGYRVRGVEISQAAIEQFFAECGLEPTITSSSYGHHYKFGGIEIVRGDAFSLDERALRDCDAIFDRGALIALPPPMRRRYANELYGSLPSGCLGLLITLDYPQHEQAGPPFSVTEDEVQTLLSPDWAIHRLESRDIYPHRHDSVGTAVSTLHTAVYRLLRR